MVSGKFAKKGHTRADYAALTHLTKREAAARLNVSMSSVHKMSTEHGMTFKPAAKTCRRREDYEALLHLTAEEAAAVLGILLARRPGACALCPRQPGYCARETRARIRRRRRRLRHRRRDGGRGPGHRQ